ncbi:MAG: endo alpha-1,4 polygalactosaminidase [Anaerovoracaceae bacterium]|jgi:hypothetical protein
MKAGKKRTAVIILAALAVCAAVIGCIYASGQKTTGELKPYGVFLGINGDEESRLDGYKTVVIEPEEFSKADISKLHGEGKVVYAYLNIGAIETYRDYYDEYKSCTLGVYEDWPDERWADVSMQKWRDFICDDLAKKYADEGYDGFFLDNADVYYHYRTDAVYDGLCDILARLDRYDMDLMINGGDTFVTRAIKDSSVKDTIDAVNQETVFTSIDFDNKTYGTQESSETEYFKKYLSEVSAAGIDVYLLEYSADEKLAKKIDSYCDRNGYKWYNAESLDLK